MSEIKGRNVLITGGAAGIGRLLGERLLREGAARLVIWDVHAAALDEATGRLRSLGFEVHTDVVNVAHTERVLEVSRRVRSDVGKIDILVNNAGIVVGKDFRHHTHAEIDHTLAVNTAAPMHVTLEFLPDMLRAGEGHIVNIASAAGMVANRKMSVYVASKWAVIGWSESLRLELERAGRDLHVTTVTPYYVDTGMFAGVKSLIPILKPELVAETIVRGIRKNSIFVRMPRIIHLLPMIKGILPVRTFDCLVGRVLGVYRSMEEFKGDRGSPIP